MQARTILLLILATVLGGGVFGETRDLSWHTIDGGGHMNSAGGQFSLAGTIGQPDAGLVMSGGGFQLTGGFWAIAVAAPASPGDCDGNGSVNLTDYASMSECLGGPSASVEFTVCACFDLNGNGTVDLLDLAAFQVGLANQ